MKRILFQGDSITDAHRSRDTDYNIGFGYPGHLSGMLGVDRPGEFECINRGISGNRIVDLYQRIKVDFINLKPDIISILIGINGVWHEVNYQNGVSAQKYEFVYDLLLTELEEALPGVKLIIMEPFMLRGAATLGTPEIPDRYEYYERETPLRAAAAKRLAEKHNCAFVPLQEAFNEACKHAPAEFWISDGVHPTPAGHQLIARQWIKYSGV